MTKNYETRKPNNNWERDVLNYYQFQDDFGDPSDITFRDRMVKARKKHSCTYCGGKIEEASQYRYEVHKFDGQVMTYKTCYYCCAAMAKSRTDDGKALERRLARRAIFDKISG